MKNSEENRKEEEEKKILSFRNQGKSLLSFSILASKCFQELLVQNVYFNKLILSLDTLNEQQNYYPDNSLKEELFNLGKMRQIHNY